MADPRGDAPGACPLTPHRPKNFSISCSFLEYLAKVYVGAPGGLVPLLRGILDPPLDFFGDNFKLTITHLLNFQNCFMGILAMYCC